MVRVNRLPMDVPQMRSPRLSEIIWSFLKGAHSHLVILRRCYRIRPFDLERRTDVP